MILVSAHETLTTERTILAILEVSLLFLAGAWQVVAVTFFVTDGALADGYRTMTNRGPTQGFFECAAREQAGLHIVL